MQFLGVEFALRQEGAWQLTGARCPSRRMPCQIDTMTLLVADLRAARRNAMSPRQRICGLFQPITVSLEQSVNFVLKE